MKIIKELISNWPALMMLIGALIVAIGSVLASIKQSRFDDEIKQKNEEIISLNKQLSQISLFTLNTVTGGDSFASVSFTNNNDYSMLEQVVLDHYGQYPLYDLNISIYSVNNQTNIGHLNLNNFGSSPKFASTLVTQTKINFDISQSDEHRFNVHFNARNGYWVQQIILKKINAKWEKAWLVKRPNSKGELVPIKKVINPDFPLQNNDIDWR